MKRIYNTAFFTLSSLAMLAFSNCTPASFSQSSNNQDQANGTTAVCNPFGGSGGPSSPNAGLVANGIYYLKESAIQSTNAPESLVNNTVEGFFDPNNSNVSSYNTNVFLTDMNFPNRYFSTGFTDSANNTVKYPDGQIMDEYFALRAKGNLIQAEWPDGDYQLAVLSDDGSIFTLTGGASDGSDFVISNDHVHSLKMGCTSQVVHFSGGAQFPLNFDYFQGPRITIGFILLYRPVSVAGHSQDPLCGQGDGPNQDAYFFLDHDSDNDPISPPIAEAPYKQLTGPYNASTGTGGWKVVEASHFTLPSGTTNSCK